MSEENKTRLLNQMDGMAQNQAGHASTERTGAESNHEKKASNPERRQKLKKVAAITAKVLGVAHTIGGVPYVFGWASELAGMVKPEDQAPIAEEDLKAVPEMATTVNDQMPLAEAFNTAREEVGVNGYFVWNSKPYPTMSTEELQALPPAVMNNHSASVVETYQEDIYLPDALVVPFELEVLEDIPAGLSLQDAFTYAREEVGPGNFFLYDGKYHSTYTASEFEELSAQPDLFAEYKEMVTNEQLAGVDAELLNEYVVDAADSTVLSDIEGAGSDSGNNYDTTSGNDADVANIEDTQEAPAPVHLTTIRIIQGDQTIEVNTQLQDGNVQVTIGDTVIGIAHITPGNSEDGGGIQLDVNPDLETETDGIIAGGDLTEGTDGYDPVLDIANIDTDEPITVVLDGDLEGEVPPISETYFDAIDLDEPIMVVEGFDNLPYDLNEEGDYVIADASSTVPENSIVYDIEEQGDIVVVQENDASDTGYDDETYGSNPDIDGQSDMFSSTDDLNPDF